MTFGEKVRYHRKKKGWTQDDLADEVGVGKNTICNYEKGKTYPHDRGIYVLLAQALDVDPDYLHNENMDSDPAVPVRLTRQERDERRRARAAQARAAAAAGDTEPSSADVSPADSDPTDADVAGDLPDTGADTGGNIITEGQGGAELAARLVEDANALFAGGDLTEEEKLGVMSALMEAYVTCKELNSRKFKPRK